MTYSLAVIVCWQLVVHSVTGERYPTDERLCYRVDTHSTSEYRTYSECREMGEWYAQTPHVRALVMLADMRQPGSLIGVRVECVGGGA